MEQLPAFRKTHGCSGEKRSAGDRPRVRSNSAATCARTRSSSSLEKRLLEVRDDGERLEAGDAHDLVAAMIAAGLARHRPGGSARKERFGKPRHGRHRVPRQVHGARHTRPLAQECMGPYWRRRPRSRFARRPLKTGVSSTTRSWPLAASRWRARCTRPAASLCERARCRFRSAAARRAFGALRFAITEPENGWMVRDEEQRQVIAGRDEARFGTSRDAASLLVTADAGIRKCCKPGRISPPALRGSDRRCRSARACAPASDLPTPAGDRARTGAFSSRSPRSRTPRSRSPRRVPERTSRALRSVARSVAGSA